MFDVVQVERGSRVQSEPSRGLRRIEFGKVTLSDHYLLPGESFLGRFACVTARHGGAASPARLYDTLGNLWFMPATPIRAQAGVSGILDRCNQGPGRPRRRRPEVPGGSYSKTPVPP